jgi:hypothetical protein
MQKKLHSHFLYHIRWRATSYHGVVHTCCNATAYENNFLNKTGMLCLTNTTKSMCTLLPMKISAAFHCTYDKMIDQTNPFKMQK